MGSFGLYYRAVALLLFVCCIHPSVSRPAPLSHHRRPSALVPEAPLVLPYHGGVLLSGDGVLTVHLLWYGGFTDSQRSIVVDFLASFQSPDAQHPSVSSWWKITSAYKDSQGSAVMSTVELGKQVMDASSSLGKSLSRSDLQTLVSTAIASAAFPQDSKALYLVLTAKDVYVDGFCMDACAFHSSINATSSTIADSTIADSTIADSAIADSTIADGSEAGKLPMAWVGNSASTCAGKCAWPYANPKDFGGPDEAPLIPPNGDAGIDGMIINMGIVLAGAATNTFDSGYYEGPADDPSEAATACVGMFGRGAYPGYAGELLVKESRGGGGGGSFNVYGANNRAFLVPALWDPSSQACAYPS